MNNSINTGTGKVTVTGGSSAQQQLIKNAHQFTIASLNAAAAAAASGQGNFSTWFGQDNSTAHSQVQSTFYSMVSKLESFDFNYDLTNNLIPQVVYPKIYTLFLYPNPAQTGSSVDAYLWKDFWALDHLNDAEATILLVQSIAHQTSYFFDLTALADISGTITESQAKSLAALDPSASLKSVRNYLYYLTSYITTSNHRNEALPALAKSHAHKFHNRFSGGLPSAHVRMFGLLSSVHEIRNNANPIMGHPVSLKTTELADDGKTPVRMVQADMTNLQWTKADTIKGGKIKIATQTPQAVPIDQSDLSFASNGNPGLATSILFHPDGKSVAGYASADFSKLNFDAIANIRDGAIVVESQDDSRIKMAHGALNYLEGELSTGKFTRFGLDGQTIIAFTELDFQQAKYVAHQLVGGIIGIRESRDDHSLSATTQIAYDQQGLPTLAKSSNYKKDGQNIHSYSSTNFSQIEFSAHGDIYNGVLLALTYRANHTLKNKSEVSYVAGYPVHMATTNYGKNGVNVRAYAELSYRGARFNSRNQVANSFVTIETFTKDKQLKSRSLVHYDGFGNTSEVNTTTYNEDGTVARRSKMDYSEAIFDMNHQLYAGQVSSVVHDAHGVLLNQSVITSTPDNPYLQDATYHYVQGKPDRFTKVIRRADGTLEEVLKLKLDTAGKPTTGVGKYYLENGRTVYKTLDLDFSKTILRGESIHGPVSVVGLAGDTSTKKSQSILVFG
ncbi:MAG: M35 family metallo-endopeptidase [Bacteroidota bacterium]